MADCLAFFPYQCQAEPLFVIHHIDLLISVNGSTRLQSIRESLFPELSSLLASQAAINNNGLGNTNTNSWVASGAGCGNRFAVFRDHGGFGPEEVANLPTGEFS